MILSKKMLKRVGESIHYYRTSTVVLNHSPVLPLYSTALWTLSYRFSMARMILALMYFLIVAHVAVCYRVTDRNQCSVRPASPVRTVSHGKLLADFT